MNIFFGILLIFLGLATLAGALRMLKSKSAGLAWGGYSILASAMFFLLLGLYMSFA